MKNGAPQRVSNISCHSATPITGIANSSRNATTKVIQAKTGMRSSVIPGARMLKTVTMKLIAPARDAMPAICSPSE